MKNREVYRSVDPMVVNQEATKAAKKVLASLSNIVLVTTGVNQKKEEVLRMVTLPVSPVDSFYVNEGGNLVFELEPNAQALTHELTEQELEQLKLDAVGAVVEDDGTLDFTPNRAKKRQSQRAVKSIKGKIQSKLKRR